MAAACAMGTDSVLGAPRVSIQARHGHHHVLAGVFRTAHRAQRFPHGCGERVPTSHWRRTPPGNRPGEVVARDRRPSHRGTFVMTVEDVGPPAEREPDTPPPGPRRLAGPTWPVPSPAGWRHQRPGRLGYPFRRLPVHAAG